MPSPPSQTNPPLNPPLILASGSRYRQELLGRLGLPFQAIAPDIDETALSAETPLATSLRLARAKAAVIARQHPECLIIGSDQVATCNGMPIGKPGNHACALAQLQAMRGQCVLFHTALCLWDSRSSQAGSAQQVQLTEVLSSVRFRDLPDAELDAYLRAEQPYDCAGSAKNEGLGIILLEKIESLDPTALTGLPLIALSGMLRNAGVTFFPTKG